MKNNLYYISALRIFAILVVVFFHCYQMLYSGHIPSVKNMYYETYYTINQCGLINIAMSLFTVISGYLFSYLYTKKGKYRDFIQLVKNKSIRLLLPYFVFSLAMIVTTGYNLDWVILEGNFCHLWYLPCLFWCFVASWLIKRFVTNDLVYFLIFITCFILALFEYFIPPLMCIDHLQHWLVWFLLGDILASYQDRIFTFIHKYHLSFVLLLPYVIYSIVTPLPYGDAWTIPYMVTTILAIISIFYLAWRFFNSISRSGEGNGERMRMYQIMDKMSNLSFGLYIFHFWFGPYLLSSTAKRIFPLEQLATDHIYLFPFIFTLLTILTSALVTYLLQKTKVGRFLLG